MHPNYRGRKANLKVVPGWHKSEPESFQQRIFASMFSREEKRQLKKDFWTSFGVFMRKHKPTSHPKVKWLNYRTGITDLYFRMEADGRDVRVCIDLQHRDDSMRELFWEQWLELKRVLHDQTEIDWQWVPDYFHPVTKIPISRIYVEQKSINYFNKEHWGDAFRFYESAMVPLDEFWTDFRMVFEALEQ